MDRLQRAAVERVEPLPARPRAPRPPRPRAARAGAWTPAAARRPSSRTRSLTGRSPPARTSRIARRRGSATALNASAVVAARAMLRIICLYRHMSRCTRALPLVRAPGLRAAGADPDRRLRRLLGAKPGSLLPSGGLGAKPGSLLPSGGLGPVDLGVRHAVARACASASRARRPRPSASGRRPRGRPPTSPPSLPTLDQGAGRHPRTLIASPADAHHRHRQLPAAGLADRPREAARLAAAARARAGAVARRGAATSPQAQDDATALAIARPGARRASTSSPTARSAARATPTASRPRSRASTSTTRRWSPAAPGGTNAVPRVVGPVPPHAAGRGRRPALPAQPHRPHDQDHPARPVHDEPAGVERALRRRGRARDGPRRGGQRGGARPVRGRRRHRPDRRAVAAVARREGARVRAPRDRPRARRRRAARPRCTPASATPTSSTTGPPATRSSPSSPTAPPTCSRSRPPSRGSTLAVLEPIAGKTVIVGVLDLDDDAGVETPDEVAAPDRGRARRSIPRGAAAGRRRTAG